MVKKWLPIILFFVFSITAHAKEEPEQLYAQSAVLMDADSGRVLFEKEGFEKRAMASTTKIMTCILALEYADLETVVSFSENAASQPKVHLNASEGEKFYLGDLLYSLMLESHNDSAVAIAEAVAGNVEAFADLMNQKAKELECEDTYFITPNGLDASDDKGIHSTTAVDLARIMSYCIMDSPKKEQFLEITSTAQYSFTNLEGNRTYSCTNHNSFLEMMDEAISGKTGFTSDAGYCYVGAVESDGRTFVVALLACGWPNNKGYKWSDMKKIVSYAMENYQYKILEEVQDLKNVTVVNGIPKTGNLFDEAEIETTLEKATEENKILLHTEEEIQIQVEQEDVLIAPVIKGQQIGSVSYLLNDEVVAVYPIVVKETVNEKDFQWNLKKIIELFVIKE